MKKYDVIKKMTEVGVVAVVRAETPDIAEKIAQACLEGGLSAIEITFTVPHAEAVITRLKERFPAAVLAIGAGTVLDAETARVAILAGAEFIVSPAFSLATAQLCNRYQIPYFPGCLTPTEIITAMEAGADIIKIFPGSAFGPSYIKAIKGPLPQANLMPTGGVSLDNVEEWIHNGVVAVGVGSELIGPAKKGDFAGVTALAKAFIAKVQAARGGQ